MVTYKVGCRVKIGNWKPFNAVNSIEVKKSVNNYMDTAKITVPSKVVIQGKVQSTAKQFKRGDKVKIFLGYNNTWFDEFEGFVSRIDKSIPCVIECEGYAFQLRSKGVLNKSYRKTTLKKVLEDIIEGTDITLSPDNDDIDIDKLDYVGYPKLEALAKLSGDCGNIVKFWFDGNVLFAGLKYLFYTEKNKTAKADAIFKAGYNYERGNDIKERKENEQDKSWQVQVKNADGSKKKYKDKTVKNENTQTLNLGILNVNNTALAERFAKEKTKSENYSGVEGTITGFLIPYCQPGFKVQHIDDKYEELNNNYLCEEVVTTVSTNGAKRKVKLSYKL